MSSISPVVARKLAAEAEKRGCDMLDAPVSGGEAGAISATLSIMIGGKAICGRASHADLSSAGQKHRPCRRCRRWAGDESGESDGGRDDDRHSQRSTGAGGESRSRSGQGADRRCSAALPSQKFSKPTVRKCWIATSSPAFASACTKKT